MGPTPNRRLLGVETRPAIPLTRDSTFKMMPARPVRYPKRAAAALTVNYQYATWVGQKSALPTRCLVPDKRKPRPGTPGAPGRPGYQDRLLCIGLRSSGRFEQDIRSGESARVHMDTVHCSGLVSGYAGVMRVLLVHHPVFAAHETGYGHPETPDRLEAAVEGVRDSPAEVLEEQAPEVARSLLELVHDPRYITRIEQFCAAGGGALDLDTRAGPASWEAAQRAAGAGPLAVRRLEQGRADSAFLAVRPPGHHARRDTAMGFCLFNNAAVTAAMLAEQGKRVAIVDWDVHHGNATEEMFRTREDILYISLHQYPYYPGTGAVVDMTAGPAARTTVDLPLPSGTAGDLYRLAFTQLVVPLLGRFQPDWLLVSAGYDAHALDPLAGINLLASDYAFMANSVSAVTPKGRTIYYLEGGYNLGAIRASVTATLAGAVGAPVPDEPSRFPSPDGAFQILDSVSRQVAGAWGL